MSLQKDPEYKERKTLHRFVDFTNKRVLEIGCGEGRLTWQYAKTAQSIFAIDLDADALRVATFDKPSDLHNKVHFLRAESEHLPFSKETFDLAILAWSL
jgi:ubiquinone/menaquinone biosynthesis C-methylase UbiE